ncbi:MAG: V/A-type H+/Na+-transporting ATPase subunit [Bacteroidales bacterium]|nr:V/A-type H+/Na+-transporting ATPase subunit [Bacteroidales bacterium]
MESKLQELTSRIYREGIEKASAEAAQIKEQASREAADMLENARREAHRIVEEAQKEAEELRRNVSNEIRLSTRQAMAALRQQITELITARMVEGPVKEAFNDREFIKKLIETIIKNWQSQNNGQGMTVILPPAEEKELGAWLETKGRQLLTAGLEVVYDEKTGKGFRIGPADKSYIISFTEEDFENFFRAYLRPRTIKLLYGGE